MPRPEAPAAPKDALRDAATVILVRRAAGVHRVLMGQRGRGAVFMASKFVFPGGAVDPDDAAVQAARPLKPETAVHLGLRATPGIAHTLAMTAVRELWEETGLALACPDSPAPEAPGPSWRAFFAAGHRPAADGLEFVFRAITPAGRPRRFDARFFMVDAGCLACDPDDFASAEGELTHLRWLTLAEARTLDLPFITEVVLAEVEARLSDGGIARAGSNRSVPFFWHSGGRSFVDAL